MLLHMPGFGQMGRNYSIHVSMTTPLHNDTEMTT